MPVEGVPYLLFDMQVSCQGDEYRNNAVMAGVLLATLVLGLPSLLIYIGCPASRSLQESPAFRFLYGPCVLGPSLSPLYSP